MRVLLVNKFYYPRGGDCVVVLNTESLLRENGVETQVFAMEYPENLQAHYQEQFASRVSFSGSKSEQWTALKRTLGLGDVTGTIEKGKSADLIVTEDDPLEDLCALRNVTMVMTQGKLIRDPSFKRNPLLDEELDKFL